jgi:DNA replication and repair protein RecF
MSLIFPETGNGEKRSGDTVAHVRLWNFRNYERLDQTLDPGLNVLYGPNAQGKTSFLEAVYLVSSTRMLRGAKDSEAIRSGQSMARVAVELAESRTEIAMVVEPGKRKIASLNKIALPRAADVIGRLPCVCVTSTDMEIVRGSPDERRLLMDLELTQLSTAYLNNLAQYKRALEHRNALLRRAQESHVADGEFETWEEILGRTGSAIRDARRVLIAAIEPLAAAVHADLAAGEALLLGYEAKDPALGPEEACTALQGARARDIARGGTSVGPHRDDLAIQVDGRDARYFASQGQQRSAVLAIKLATHLNQTSVRGERPLLLLDDILSDLDQSRRSELVSWILEHAGQAILTCTEPETAGPDLTARAKLLRVDHGHIAEE